MRHSLSRSVSKLLRNCCFNLRRKKQSSIQDDEEHIKWQQQQQRNPLVTLSQPQQQHSSVVASAMDRRRWKERARKRGLSLSEANRKARIVYFMDDNSRLEIRAAPNGGFELRRLNNGNGDPVSEEDLKRMSTLLPTNTQKLGLKKLLVSAAYRAKEDSVETMESAALTARILNNFETELADLVCREALVQYQTIIGSKRNSVH